MNDSEPIRLIILAGGESRRMGKDKALIELAGKRLIDHVIARATPHVEWLGISAVHDYGTGLPVIPDDPDSPRGPVGAIFTLAREIPKRFPGSSGFLTMPVDAPFAPAALINQLATRTGSAVVQGPDRLHPVFARWDCAVVNSIRATHDSGDAPPSLHWLARQSDAELVSWDDEAPFLNLNTPEDLAEAQARMD